MRIAHAANPAGGSPAPCTIPQLAAGKCRADFNKMQFGALGEQGSTWAPVIRSCCRRKRWQRSRAPTNAGGPGSVSGADRQSGVSQEAWALPGLGPLKDGAGKQRAPTATGAALIELAATALHHAMRRTPAVRTANALRPARRLMGRPTLGGGTEPPEKFIHVQSGLEPDSIHRRGSTLRDQLGHSVRPQGTRHRLSLAHGHCQSDHILGHR